MNKILAISFVAVVVVVVAWVVMKNGNEVAGPVSVPTPTISPTTSPTSTVSPSPGASPTPSSPGSSGPSATPAPTQQSSTVTYTSSGYSPAVITIKRGQTVTWKNNGSSGMWTASAIHPTHAVYPTTGGCIGSTFDACAPIPSGQSWSFKFDQSGTWKYHNHVNSAHTGTVVVE